MQKLVFLVNISVISEIVDIVNVLRSKYFIKGMTVGGNDKLDVKAVFCARVEGRVSFTFVDIY